MNQPKILVIQASTRQGRFSDTLLTWIKTELAKRTDAEYIYADLRQYQLPYYDEPMMAGKAEELYAADDVRKKWHDLVDGADGFLVVTPEYNHGYPAILKSAFDALAKPWRDKPMAFVSYGGLAGGARAVEQLRQVAIELNLATVRAAVHLPMVFQSVVDGKFSNPMADKSLDATIKALIRWANIFREGREKYPVV